MEREGPSLEELTRRLIETPADFLAEPRIGKRGVVDVAAVVWDLLRDLSGEPPGEAELNRFRPTGAKAAAQRNRLRLVLVASWLLHDEWFRGKKELATAARQLLDTTVGELESYLDAERVLNDPDRREELVRRSLSGLGLRPAGETVAQASDRLQTLDSAERERVLREAAAAERRAQQIREAMAKAAAQETANRFGE
ncbi:MAG TPA: hypothetical protein VKE74_31125 [Gemmataceae bacterium]|nr:hypothetical protein [Gemmataceae bacterium]